MVVKQGKEIAKILYQCKRVTDIYKQGEILFPNMRGLLPDTKNSIIDTLGIDAWMQTLDYVRQKPELVPFINEDPMLVCSLVETNKMRWLVGDGKAYIQTEYIPTYDEMVSISFLLTKHQSIMALFGSRNTAGQANAGSYEAFIDQSKYRMDYAKSNADYATYIIALDTAITVTQRKGYLKINDTVAYSSSASHEECKYPFCIFTLNNGGSPMTTHTIDCHFGFVKGDTAHFIPCQHNGTCGMLDLVSLQFYPNANTQGAFTIELTDK